MGYLIRLIVIFILVFSMVILKTSNSTAADEHKWAVTLYHAKFVQEELFDIFTRQHYFENSYLIALALAREFARSWDHLGWELEGQVVKHYGMQHNWEFNGVLVLRWHRFPWDRHLNTSIAFGEGLSRATRTPFVEAKDHDRTAKLLNYLLFELTLGLPRLSNWHLSGRIHHRSGVYGTFGGVHGASNFLGAGVRYTF
jgi:hypothetical protein